jgi:hypothetical protein
MSQFPRRLRVGDYVVIHYRTGNRSNVPFATTIRARLIQANGTGAPTMQELPDMQVMLSPHEGINLHLFLPLDGRFREGPVRVDCVFEAQGVRRPSGTKQMDRLEIVGARTRPFSGDPRLLPSIGPQKLAALYIAAMEYADLATLLDRWDDLPGSLPDSLEHRCMQDAMAIDAAACRRAAGVGEARTNTGRELIRLYERDPEDFTIGYARLDLPYMLGWHLMAMNPAAPLIRAGGLTFRSEQQWFRRNRP